MLLRVCGNDDDIVELHEAGLPTVEGQYDVQGTLKGRGGLPKSEGHAQYRYFRVQGSKLFHLAWTGNATFPVPLGGFKRCKQGCASEAIGAVIHG